MTYVTVILGFNNYHLKIVDVATNARNKLRKDIAGLFVTDDISINGSMNNEW